MGGIPEPRRVGRRERLTGAQRHAAQAAELVALSGTGRQRSHGERFDATLDEVLTGFVRGLEVEHFAEHTCSIAHDALSVLASAMEGGEAPSDEIVADFLYDIERRLDAAAEISRRVRRARERPVEPPPATSSVGLAEAIAFDAVEVLEIRIALAEFERVAPRLRPLVDRMARLTARLEVRARQAFEVAGRGDDDHGDDGDDDDESTIAAVFTPRA